MTTLVTGAGGMIGGFLVGRLLAEGRDVKAIDIKPREEWWQRHPGARNVAVRDVGDRPAMLLAGVDEVFHLAENMGGIGFITANRFACTISVVPSLRLLETAVDVGVDRFVFSSSACVYRHDDPREDIVLAEGDAFPSLPEPGYGEAKLLMEQACRYAHEDHGIETRIARFHNCYGPSGPYEGGREKAPSALCRKVAVAALTGEREIRVWGDGRQRRTFMYVTDAVDGLVRLAASDHHEPVNVGASESVSVDDLVSLIAEVAGVDVTILHEPDRPQGVRGRSSDNTLCRAVLGWEPSVPLRDGLETTYAWVHEQVAQRLGVATR